MAQLFEDEKAYPDNRQRGNFVFFGYPFNPPLAREDYRQVLRDLEGELGLRLWYFLDEITTAELMRKVWRAILRCDIAIFDVSGGNPNVAFEVGLAVATNRPCITMLKTGEANPLGGADLSYAERVEYSSVATLKDKLRALLISKTTASRKTKEVAYHIYDGGKALTHDQLQAHTLAVLKTVYREKRIDKRKAEQIFGDRGYADAALSKLRELDVLKMEGQRRGAIYVFSDKWVYHDHEVAGV
jgi:nucleoside 2-deoxyribosyltransferase